MDSVLMIRLIAALIAVFIVGLIIYRRKKHSL